MNGTRLHERHWQAAWNDGVIKVYETSDERAMLESAQRETVAKWQPERIAALKYRCKIPVTRIIALLGITQGAYSRLSSGDFTPSAALCLRMAHLEEMADAGELHSGKEFIPKQREMRRRMAHFRAWWFNRPATAEFPLITVEIRVKWGGAPYQQLRLPVKPIPALRMCKWEGLLPVVKTITTAIRKLAQANGRLYWRDIEDQFWRAYATDTLPQIVLERAAITKRMAAARFRATRPPCQQPISPMPGDEQQTAIE